MYRIAVFSDIHGNAEALDAILSDIRGREIDEIICLGDLIGIGPNPKECLDRVLHDQKVQLVLGNHEYFFLTGKSSKKETMGSQEMEHYKWTWDQLSDLDRQCLKKVPMMIERHIDGKDFAFLHYAYNEDGFLPAEMLNLENYQTIFSDMEYDYVFIGHEHESHFLQTERTQFIDVGSSGCVSGNETFYVIIEIDQGNIQLERIVLSYDRELFVSKLLNTDYPEHDFMATVFFGLKTS